MNDRFDPFLREHKLVQMLEEKLQEQKGLREHSRVNNLPGMLLRHGLLQVALFLNQKDSEKDRDLYLLLTKAMQTLSGMERDLMPSALAREDADTYLFLNELAVQAAVWIRRVAAAYETLGKVTKA